MDALKLYGQNEKGLDLLVQKKFLSEDIGMEFSIEVCYVSDRERTDREISQSYQMLKLSHYRKIKVITEYLGR